MEQSKTTHTSTTNTNEQALSEMEIRRSHPAESNKQQYIKNTKISRIKNFISDNAEVAKLRDQPVRFAKKLLHKNSGI